MPAENRHSSLPPRTAASLDASEATSPFTRRVLRPAQEFIHQEGAAGRLLIVAAAAGLILANSPFADAYHSLWHTELGFEVGSFSFMHPLLEWVNSGLMAIFFFLVTLEVKREFVDGALSSRRDATLPVVAAIGGMVVPAALYLLITTTLGGDPRGWGVPIATDIAFAVAIASLLHGRVSGALLAFLLAFAIVDDIGAILVIAVFYTESLAIVPLIVAGALLLALYVLRRLGLHSTMAFVIFGLLVWLAIFESGVHATIAGVLMALLTPAHPLDKGSSEHFIELAERYRKASEDEDEDVARWSIGRLEAAAQRTEAPLDRMIRLVHPWSGYVVLPIFALANAGIPITASGVSEALSSPIAIGIFVALVIGKPVGIMLATIGTVRLGAARLPAGAGLGQVGGIAVLAGIGFTVSIFIAELAFTSEHDEELAKLGIFAASATAALLGWLVLRLARHTRAG
jgi:Na+:H+ antiporter, NhaA family